MERGVGLGSAPPAVYGRDETRALLRQAAERLGLVLTADHAAGDADPWALSISKLERSLERFRLCGLSASPGDDGPDPALVRELTSVYETLLCGQGAVDYPAMLLLPLRLFEAEPRALSTLQDAYRQVLVDEVQDTCARQYSVLQQLVSRHRNLALVGDPLQSVYSFRGADPTLLLAFPRDYPEAQVFVLDQNHRSTATVVGLANAVAAPLANRPDSWPANPPGPAAHIYQASDDIDEARFVACEIARLLQSGEIATPGQAAALFRTNAQARALADALRSRGVAVQLRAEADLFVRAEIRDLLAYLRLVHNPNDAPALARILDTPSRRLRSVERAFRRHPVPIPELPDSAQKLGGEPARQAVETLLTPLADLHSAFSDRPPVDALEAVLDRTAYAVWLSSQRDGPARLQHVEHLHALLRHATASDLATWLVDLHLGEAETEPDPNAVALLTVHGAKGREWPVVFVIGVEEGLMPHVRPPKSGEPEPDDSEERRLTYVALSRCQVQLYLTYCRSRRPLINGELGRPEPRRPSRYLRALPPDLVTPAA